MLKVCLSNTIDKVLNLNYLYWLQAAVRGFWSERLQLNK